MSVKAIDDSLEEGFNDFADKHLATIVHSCTSNDGDFDGNDAAVPTQPDSA